MYATNDPILQIYFKTLRKKIKLSTEEELKLSRRIQAGDTKALDRLVSANLLFVVKVAYSYRGRGLDLPDLISVGNIGLIKAAQHFDGSKNFRFITYAVWWIRQHILTALADQSRVVKVPSNVATQLYKLRQAREAITQGQDSLVNSDALAERMGITIKNVEMLLYLETKPLFLNVSIDEDGGREIIDFISTEGDFYDGVDDKTQALREVISELSEKEREILNAYYGLDGGVPMTLIQISEKYDVTRERVRQIKERSIKVIRRKLSDRIAPVRAPKKNPHSHFKNVM